MKTEDIENSKPSCWVPIDNKQQLAALGKLLEEAGELVAIVSRCIIQGIDDCDPDTGRPNLGALEDEVADVKGLLGVVSLVLGLDGKHIDARASRKFRKKLEWINMLADEVGPDVKKY